MDIDIQKEEEKLQFTNHIIRIQKKDMLYLFTDGFPDQLGGLENRKFYYGPFRDLLMKIHAYASEEQKIMLDKEFSEWRNNRSQTDDVLIWGIRF